MSLEGELGAISKLSWLVRAQVVAKRVKLTVLGGLRGAKLQLKKALGGPKEVPWEAKSGMVDIDPGTNCGQVV